MLFDWVILIKWSKNYYPNYFKTINKWWKYGNLYIFKIITTRKLYHLHFYCFLRKFSDACFQVFLLHFPRFLQNIRHKTCTTRSHLGFRAFGIAAQACNTILWMEIRNCWESPKSSVLLSLTNKMKVFPVQPDYVW